MAAFLDLCRFNTSSGGTGDWVYSSEVTGCQSPAAAGAIDGREYKFQAISSDQTQWELAEGAYTAASGTLARTTVLYNSAGTGSAAGQSGAGAKIDFSLPPTVAIVAIKEDLISVEEANAFTATQQAQARANIGAAPVPGAWTNYTPTVSATSGSLGGASASGRYHQLGKLVFFYISIVITSNGSAAGSVRATLPVQSGAGTRTFIAKENAMKWNPLYGVVFDWLPYIDLQNFDNSYPGGDGCKLDVSGVYESI